MIMNACTVRNEMVDENECKECNDEYCRHAGEDTTKERLDEIRKMKIRLKGIF